MYTRALPFKGAMSDESMAMTASEKARFDCQGFLLRPGVLDAATVAELREAVDVMEHAPHTLPPHQRRCPGGCTGSAQSLFSLCLSLSLSSAAPCSLSGRSAKETGEGRGSGPV